MLIHGHVSTLNVKTTHILDMHILLVMTKWLSFCAQVGIYCLLEEGEHETPSFTPIYIQNTFEMYLRHLVWKLQDKHRRGEMQMTQKYKFQQYVNHILTPTMVNQISLVQPKQCLQSNSPVNTITFKHKKYLDTLLLLHWSMITVI